MKESTNGYVIINKKHPSSGKPQFLPRTFRISRKDCISDFIKGSNSDWKYWYRKWNFRCVKAESTVIVKQ